MAAEKEQFLNEIDTFIFQALYLYLRTYLMVYLFVYTLRDKQLLKQNAMENVMKHIFGSFVAKTIISSHFILLISKK